MLDRLPILSVELLDPFELAVVSAILGDELRGDLNRMARVNGEIRPRSPELPLAKTVWLDVTTVLVTHALEAVWAVVTAISSFTAGLFLDIAGVHGVCGGNFVRLPDVDLSAASAVLSSSGIDIGLGWHPILHIGLTVDPLQVVRALGIAVAHAVLGPSIAVAACTAIFLHGDEAH